MTDYLALREEAYQLAEQLLGKKTEKCAELAKRLVDICTQAQDKDFLLIHNPGGRGSTYLEHCLQWERSIVEGVSDTIERLGYSWLLTQHFRSGSGWRERIRFVKELFRLSADKVNVLAAELEFIIRHLSSIKIILIGGSQGAAFGNAVMQRLHGLCQVYSIELGIPFLHRSRRVVTERTLAIDGNGLMPDAMMEWDIATIVKVSSAAPFRWIKYRLQGKRVKFTYCINVPGHDYNWDYPEVRQQIGHFLNTNFGTKRNFEESRL